MKFLAVLFALILIIIGVYSAPVEDDESVVDIGKVEIL